MAHNHEHRVLNYNRAFAIGISLNVGFVVVEVVFGILSDSIALLADAGHNLSDVLGLLLAWGATLLSMRTPTHRRTYGWKSSTLLAALANAIVLLVAVGGIAWESIRRFSHPQLVEGHVVVVVAGIAISFLGWLWIDPVVGLTIAAIILIGTWRLFRESFDLVLHAVPR
ncbi:MAG: cation transporter, partial [Deltaproteobacteria bacterium]|nr:cation transporter [Deltaproteobacteria bacterium]